MTRLAPPLSERNETPLERSDRHPAELILLTVPFTNRFGELTAREHWLYFATLTAAGAGTSFTRATLRQRHAKRGSAPPAASGRHILRGTCLPPGPGWTCVASS
jgi:hypothetical protein